MTMDDFKDCVFDLLNTYLDSMLEDLEMHDNKDLIIATLKDKTQFYLRIEQKEKK